ncbi:Atu2307/SP_0267 family LLM class monooxygenase [Oceanobacter mangrovi]|uniref:Atu2307/SP_0267 family LLM class monooxygenase n=1 Tax=Oceanobacter mangrovi TaxID=2862510 RepID=UPI001C8E4848|nr:Atu2307/SP_0267 family LLM class monooxygenase [Oceanobacter mangrovi]
MANIELGLHSFGDVTAFVDSAVVDSARAQLKSMAQVLRDVVEQGVLADEVGVDYLGLGEHHRDDFAISSPEVILGAIAAKTRRIRLGTAVTVLSTDDPVRLFQRFATLDALANGRTEVILGRGAFTESYPLFGFQGADYDLLFEERLDLFMQLTRENPLSWQGKTRPELNRAAVFPQFEQQPLTTWVGVGGTPQSVVRVARHDAQLMLAIIGGAPKRFRPLVDLYLQSCSRLGRSPKPIGMHSPGFVAETDQQAKERFWPYYQRMMNRLGRERGWSAMTKDRFIEEVEQGALFVGSAETVANKIARAVVDLSLQRFDLKYVTGPVPHEYQLDCIRLYGEQVMPRVRELLEG